MHVLSQGDVLENTTSSELCFNDITSHAIVAQLTPACGRFRRFRECDFITTNLVLTRGIIKERNKS